jgi:hypothetical protein
MALAYKPQLTVLRDETSRILAHLIMHRVPDNKLPRLIHKPSHGFWRAFWQPN